MLRGLDENFCDPMYGVFVSHLYSGKGIATLTIYHALTMCRILEYKKLLLKVYPDNKKAINLYNYLGFQYLKDDKKSGQAILFKIV